MPASRCSNRSGVGLGRRRLRQHHADRNHHVLDRVRLQRAVPVLVLPHRPSQHHRPAPDVRIGLEHRHIRQEDALHRYRDRLLEQRFLHTRRRRARHPQLARTVHRNLAIREPRTPLSDLHAVSVPVTSPAGATRRKRTGRRLSWRILAHGYTHAVADRLSDEPAPFV